MGSTPTSGICSAARSGEARGESMLVRPLAGLWAARIHTNHRARRIARSSTALDHPRSAPGTRLYATCHSASGLDRASASHSSRGVRCGPDQSWTCRVGAWQRCSPVGRSPWSATKPRPSCGAFVLLVRGPVEIRSRRRSIEPFTASSSPPPFASTRANCNARLGIPITSPIRTLVDLATRLESDARSRINEQTSSISSIRKHFAWGSTGCAGNAGSCVCAGSLDRRTFRAHRLRDSSAVLASAPIGLPTPRTRRMW